MPTGSVTLGDVQHYLLILFRMTGIFIAAPIFGSEQVPPLVKILLSAIFAGILFPFVARAGAALEPNAGAYLMAVAGEWSLGVLIGLAALVLFAAVQFGGQIIGHELGMTLANVIDPITQEQVSIVGHFKLMLATLIYLGIDGHHILLRAALGSFQAVPLMGFQFTKAGAVFLADRMVGDFFVLGLQIAAPAMVTLMLLMLGIALLAKAAPEFNVFVLGFSIRLLIGFVAMIVGVEAFAWIFSGEVAAQEGLLGELIRLWG